MQVEMVTTLSSASTCIRIVWVAGVCLFLFVWSLSSHSRIFQSYEDVTIAGEGLRILFYARHS